VGAPRADRLVDGHMQRDFGSAFSPTRKAEADRYATDAEYRASLRVTKFHGKKPV
jgi:hypothetical protein